MEWPGFSSATQTMKPRGSTANLHVPFLAKAKVHAVSPANYSLTQVV